MPDNTSSSASSTMHTYLLYKDSGSSSYSKLADIKDYPAMGGSPEQIETTTLSNEKATFVNGVQSMPTFEFLANYTKDDYKTISDLGTQTVYDFALAFGKSATNAYGELGVFTWKGQISVWVEGGGVNAAREMRISTAVTEEVKFSENTISVS